MKQFVAGCTSCIPSLQKIALLYQHMRCYCSSLDFQHYDDLTQQVGLVTSHELAGNVDFFCTACHELASKVKIFGTACHELASKVEKVLLKCQETKFLSIYLPARERICFVKLSCGFGDDSRKTNSMFCERRHQEPKTWLQHLQSEPKVSRTSTTLSLTR